MTLKDLVLKGSTTKIEDISRFQVLKNTIYNDRVGGSMGPVIVLKVLRGDKDASELRSGCDLLGSNAAASCPHMKNLGPLYLFRAQVFFCFAGEVWAGLLPLGGSP